MSLSIVFTTGSACLLALASTLNAANFGEPEKIKMVFSAFDGDTLTLKGVDARRQLVVTGTYSDGDERDLSRQVQYASSPAGIVTIDKTGWVSPLKDGKAEITAKAVDPYLVQPLDSIEVKGKSERLNVYTLSADAIRTAHLADYWMSERKQIKG